MHHAVAAGPDPLANQKFLSNGEVRIGVDLSFGGSVFWFSELPAVFVDHALENIVFYKGDKPWTGAPLAKEKPGWPNEGRNATEEWAGYVGPDGRGLGVHFPGSTHLTTYRFQGEPGPKGGGCSYFAPVRTMQIKPGFVHDYTVHLTIGSPGEMRERFGALRQAAAVPKPGSGRKER